jgi:hypothetical protein
MPEKFNGCGNNVLLWLQSSLHCQFAAVSQLFVCQLTDWLAVKLLNWNSLTVKLLLATPTQWFLVSRPTSLVTILYCLTALGVIWTLSVSTQSKSYIMTEGQSVILGVKPRLGPKIRFLVLSESFSFVDVWHILWQDTITTVNISSMSYL